MRFLVLGSGAGGGVPQWNAFNAGGRAAFDRSPLVPFRSQCSAAVSLDGETWALLNASPDLRSQIISNRPMHPRRGPRSSPIAAVLLTGGEIDQVTGLLTLREGHPFSIFASRSTLDALAMNPIFEALPEGRVPRVEIAPGAAFEPLPGLRVEAIDLPGKAPLYLERRRADPTESRPGDCVAFELSARGKRAIFAPSCAAMTEAFAARLDGADLALFDGTLFTDEEMIASGEGSKTARRMGHMPMTGAGGAVEAFAGLRVGRKLFVHVNNTNPVARFDAPERRVLLDAGWEIAEDGMEIAL